MTAVLANRSNAKRRALDYYPTPPDATHALMQFLDLPPVTVWECACGDGAMSKVIESYGCDVVSSDIRHTGFGLGGVDFLMSAPMKCDAIITNPPFALAEQFIERANQIASTSAMLLKSQYWHARKRLQLFNELRPAWVLPLTWRPDFMAGERGGSPTMDVLWCVWMEGDTETKFMPLARPPMAA